MLKNLEDQLTEITGFAATSLQPNSGAQGEFSGLMVIRAYHESRGGDTDRNICLIPSSAHGTNPASAVMAGMKVVVVKTDELGNIDWVDFLEKTEESSLDLNLKLYRLVKKGRIWLGASFRQNFIKIDTPSEYTIPNQNYTHFTPVFGMNYDRYLFSYHYTSNLGTLNLGTSGLHYFSLGITLF